VEEEDMKTYTIKPDNAKKLDLLKDIQVTCEVAEGEAKFTSGSAFLTALTFLRRKGARCAVESVG